MINIASKRTKIITTIGPSSEDDVTLKRLFEEGMNTIRLNFSHADFAEHGARIAKIKKMREELGLPISILLDTKGPEIRIGKFVNDKQEFTAKQEVVIYTDEESYKKKVCKSGEMTVSYDMSKDLKKGKMVLIDDGKLEIEVKSVEKNKVIGVTLNSHLVKTNKRVNLPGTNISMPFLAQKDIDDIKFGIEQGIDYIAASFVNKPSDIQAIKKILKEKKAEHIQIISKIESQYAVDHFDEILKETDAVMIARGDLGLEVNYFDVPTYQKMMIRKCRAVGKPVIVATQMLDSMENKPSPTRAEVTDVYIATELGADATMLSGESASGNYPIQAVKVMATINKAAEAEFYNKTYYEQYLKSLPIAKPGSREEKAKKVTLKSKKGEYKFAVVLSRTGKLLKAIAKFRPNTNIIGIVANEKLVNAFGVTSSVFVEPNIELFSEISKDKELAAKVVKKFGGKKGDKYLVVQNTNIKEFTL